MLGLDLMTVMDTSVTGFTNSKIGHVSLPHVAVIVVSPTASEVAKPEVPIVATLELDERQIICAVRSCVVLSENVPVAANLTVVPLAMPGLDGVTAIDMSVAEFTVSKVDPVMLLDVAVTVVEPAASEVAKPEVPIVATPVLDELQITCAVRSCVVLSENVPVAAN
jgi:NADH dehydrogenase FAD-containing subunit